MEKFLIFVFCISTLAGCAASIGGQRVGGVYSSSCKGYEQAAANAEATLKLAEELEAEGKLTKSQLIEVDQESGLYSQKLSDLCSFLKAGDITFEQYLVGVDKADNRYREIRTLVLSKQP